MPTLALTDRHIKAFRVDQRTEFWDERVTGLGVRVSPKGRKSFVLMYRGEGGRLRRLTLGQYPALSLADARDLARMKLGEVARGEDPAQERSEARQAATFGELAEAYLKHYARPRKKTWREDERILNHDVLPVWGNWKTHEIQRRHVRELLDGIIKRGSPVMANRVLGILSKLFNWAVDREILEQSPCFRLAKPAKEAPRDRVLSGEEIRELWWYLDNQHAVMAKAFRLLLLTAQRSGELRQMRWEQIEDDVWQLPGDSTKNQRGHLVPLSPQALRVLGQPSPLAREIVLESPSKAGSYLTATALSRAAQRYRKELGWYFTPHDLRRTAATHMGRLGVSGFIIARVLNHVQQGVTHRVYNLWEYLPEKRDALERWGEWVEDVVHGRG